MGKLGTMAQDGTAVMADIAALDAGGAMANGPEDLIDWDAIDWQRQDAQVQRLQQRIFKAAQAGDHKQVRNLQKLMLRSRANTLVSVRRVSQQNTGRHTAGVDGNTALTAEARSDLAMLLHRRARAAHCRCDGCTYQRKAGNARSAFQLSRTAPSSSGCVTHWNQNGRRGWTQSSTGSGRAADAMTRSR
jgi:hypothetical protein